MRNRQLRMLTISQFAIIIFLLCLTLANEVIDVPHYVFNDAPTLYSQRMGEVFIELFIFALVFTIQTVLFRKLSKRIRILEGFIPICANCKKIRTQEEQWEQMETYITKHSLARFSHSICPDCMKQLYPDFCNSEMQETKGGI